MALPAEYSSHYSGSKRPDLQLIKTSPSEGSYSGSSSFVKEIVNIGSRSLIAGFLGTGIVVSIVEMARQNNPTVASNEQPPITPTPTKQNRQPMVFGNGFPNTETEEETGVVDSENLNVTVTGENFEQIAQQCKASFYTIYQRDTRKVIAARCFDDAEVNTLLDGWISGAVPSTENPRNIIIELNHANGYGGRSTLDNFNRRTK